MEYIPAKTIVTSTRNPGDWFGCDYNMNIYRGCSHGCIYCDSRSEVYNNPDFDSVKVKENALEIIRNDLRKKRKIGVVGTGAMSDPYNPLEAELMLTRGALELLAGYGFGVAIATKSPLVTRDIDLLLRASVHAPVMCKITVTTADDRLCRVVEPNVAPTSERFKAIETLSRAGIYSGILLMPILPWINDTDENIREIVTRAADSGAKFIMPFFGLTMREGQREYFYEKLDVSFPGLRARYEKKYGQKYSCPSPREDALWELFSAECDRRGLKYDMPRIIRYFRGAYDNMQFKLGE